MDLEILLKLAVPFVGLLVAIVQGIRQFGGPSARDTLLQDVQIRNALPAGSEARHTFDTHIRDEALRLVGKGSARRDPFGITIAIVFLMIGVGCVATIYGNDGGWWWLLSPFAVFFLLFGFVGLASDVPKKEGDERGRAIKAAE